MPMPRKRWTSVGPRRAATLTGGSTVTAPAPAGVRATRRGRARLLELFGTLDCDPDFDYKAERWRALRRTTPAR